jgi:hypothetical protein
LRLPEPANGPDSAARRLSFSALLTWREDYPHRRRLDRQLKKCATADSSHQRDAHARAWRALSAPSRAPGFGSMRWSPPTVVPSCPLGGRSGGGAQSGPAGGHRRPRLSRGEARTASGEAHHISFSPSICLPKLGKKCQTSIEPASIVRYNNLRFVTINGGPAPGHSSGDAMNSMQTVAAATLLPGFSFEWTGTALQEKQAAEQTGSTLGLAIVFAYLFLVRLYESWSIPVAACCRLSSSCSARWLSGLDNNLFAQVGMLS